MSHDEFCWFSKDGRATRMYQSAEDCKDCRSLALARADEREKAVKRIQHLIDNPRTIDDSIPVESLIAAVKGEQE